MVFVLLKASTMTLSFPGKQKLRKMEWSLQVPDDIWIRVWNTNWDLKQKKKKNPVKKTNKLHKKYNACHLPYRQQSHPQSKQPRHWFFFADNHCNDTKADNICHLHCVAFQRISSFISHSKTIDCVRGTNVLWLLSLRRNASSNTRRGHGNNALALGVLHAPTHPPFVRWRHKPSHLWNKSPETIRRKQALINVRSHRLPEPRRKETLVVQTSNSRVCRPPSVLPCSVGRRCRSWHKHLHSRKRRRRFQRDPGTLIPVASSSVSALSPSVSPALFPSVSQLFLKPRKAPL